MKRLTGSPNTYHPHVHLVIPAVAFDAKRRLWRSKSGAYLFDHKALAIVFRAKMLEGIRQAGLTLPGSYPTKWVVDCKAVGTGHQALVYLGRYLYRGVCPKKTSCLTEMAKSRSATRTAKPKNGKPAR